MEKGIEEEENNLYKQTEDVADNVLNSLNGINPSMHMPNTSSNLSLDQNVDYTKLFNILYEAFLKALNSCKLTLDDDGFAKIVRNELYEVM